MAARPHDPSRFDVYTELPDGTGFTIKGSSFVFKFDRFGGWFDEYGNYYNADGTPEDPPSESDQEDEEQYRSQGSHSYHSEDEFEREFGRPKDYESDEEQPHHEIHYAKIASNINNLNSYPAGKPFRINFRNMPYLTKREQALNHYQSKVKGILNVIFLENEKKQFNGNGYFVLEDYASGEALVKLEGETYEGREVYFTAPDVQELIQDPVENEQLYPDFHSKGNKKYITKGPKPKEEEKPAKTEVKVKTEVKPKAEEKQQDPESFRTYKFLKTAFPKKSSFKEWLLEQKFDHADVVEKVEKIEGNENYALVTMKVKVFNKLNGTFYDGNKIEFELQQ